MVNLLALGTLFFTGVIFGWVLRECVLRATRRARLHATPGSMYGSPELSRWFYLRSQETDPRLNRMPLRTYKAHKMGEM